MVYPYDYMDDWEKFNETTLSEDADYMHLKRLWYGTLGEHHDFILRVTHYFWLIFSKTSEKCV